MARNPEQQRLHEAYEQGKPWLRWGPYLSERQWGTVREDYSDDGKAWSYFTHDQARYRTYRWGEDGLAGLSDDRQRICFALALWNGKDPFLKERLFGLSNPQGNHGEDVKEYYFYLDHTPSHAYMKYLYKYPQAAFPYKELVEQNAARTRLQPEFELLDTGIFDEGRYFDVFVEYAKAGPEDLLIQITACNRGPEPAPLHLIPTIWFRNTWQGQTESKEKRPLLREDSIERDRFALRLDYPDLGSYYLYGAGPGQPLFTENESNLSKLGKKEKGKPHAKDGLHAFVVEGDRQAVNPGRVGTKAGIVYQQEVAPGGQWTVRLRLCRSAPESLEATYSWWSGDPFGQHFESIIDLRRKEADTFYEALTPGTIDAEQARVMRQALAGMLWNKQFYYYDLSKWLEQHGAHPLLHAGSPRDHRNGDWFHMLNRHIISMPDKWEYPWYAAWDLAFQAIGLAMVDVDFAKQQLDLMLRENYLHPNGQLPAYEWNFSDVNPPVHAWATLFVYHMDRNRGGQGDLPWLKHAFQKLMLNFTWWVNRKDPSGRNVFEGGFLGLDNIGVFDRSDELPTGGHLEQADGTAWMALYSQNMFEMALELARHNEVYEEMALKFFEHFLYIATAMDRMGDNQSDMWDDEDGFFYDLLRLPDGSYERLRVRSMVGLLPLCATTVVDAEIVLRHPRLAERAQARMERHPDWLTAMHDPRQTGERGRRLFAVLNEDKLRRVLRRLLDEEEFLSPYGIRALSRYHEAHPYVFTSEGEEYLVKYLPAESDSGMFGGNSNWRGPIWFPVNTLLIRALLQFYMYYGNDFRVECPTGSGQLMNLYEVARTISQRLERLFLPDPETGQRPAHGDQTIFRDDPYWSDLPLFYEYFHGDTGRGLGASHQTGWTGLVAWLTHMFHTLSAEELMDQGFRHRRPAR